MGLTTDRNDPGLKETREDGQQETYMVLSEEERANPDYARDPDSSGLGIRKNAVAL